MSSDEGDEILSKWPPKAVVCIIDDALLCELSGLNENDSRLSDNFAKVESIDLHLRDGEKGKIRRIENLHKLPGLTQLNLSFNAIHRIEGLSSLKLLVELNLAENSISRIEGIFHLTRLERLNLCGNSIERIPSSFTSLRSLVALRLNRNRLGDLRDLQLLGDLPALRNLRIDNNLFPAPPAGAGAGAGAAAGLSPAARLRHHLLQAAPPALQVLDNEPVTAAERQR